jgi:hypothetical protein
VHYFEVAAISAPPDSESWRAPRAWRSSFLGLVEICRKRGSFYSLPSLTLGWKSRNRPAADIVGARDFAERFLPGVDALDRLALLMDAVRRGARPAFARACADQIALKPVILPPGCLTLATKPCATGSETDTNTTGTVLVACRIAVRLVSTYRPVPLHLLHPLHRVPSTPKKNCHRAASQGGPADRDRCRAPCSPEPGRPCGSSEPEPGRCTEPGRRAAACGTSQPLGLSRERQGQRRTLRPSGLCS